MSIYLPIAELSMNLAMLVAMGLAVGVLSGMFGIGGGFISTPLLIFLGIPPAIAVGTGAAQVVATSVSGGIAHWQKRNVDVKMGLLLMAGGVVGALAGVRLQLLLRQYGHLDLSISLTYVLVLGVIGTLMLAESVRTLRRSAGQSAGAASARAGRHTWLQGLPFKQRFPVSKLYVSALPALAIGAVVGWLTALMGVGGGFLIVPALIYLMGVPTRIAIGTSVFQIVLVTSITVVLQAAINQSVDVLLALPLMLGGVVGAIWGVDIGQRINAVQLRILLAVLVLLVAARMAATLALPPQELYSNEMVRGP